MSRFEHRRRDDEGMTLMELMVTSTILVVVLGLVFISMDLINTISTGVSNQYQEFNQVIPAMTPFRSLLSAEVEPAPPNGAGAPTPPFATIGNFSMTFYANVGTGFQNITTCPSGQSCTSGGTTAGPAKIVLAELDANGNPATACSAQFPCSLQMRMYLPVVGVVAPGVSTCPGVSPTGTACQYDPNSYRLLANVQNVVNDPSQVDGNGAPTQPLFTYTLFDTTYDQTIQLSPLEVQQQTITGLTSSSTYTTPYPTDSQSLTACQSASASANYPTLAVSCPADAVQSVSVDLQVAKPGTGLNGTVEDNLTAYRYAESPGATISPFQYQASVG
jgi:prepilin-type N-terminal cleavage/methylation domain-containing protein